MTNGNQHPERLTLLRYIFDMSMQDVAKKFGISKQAISKFESGKMQFSAATLNKIAMGFHQEPFFFTREVTRLKLSLELKSCHIFQENKK